MNRERGQGDLAQAAEAFGGVRSVAAELEARVRARMETEARLASVAGTGELDRLARALPVALAALARVQGLPSASPPAPGRLAPPPGADPSAAATRSSVEPPC